MKKEFKVFVFSMIINFFISILKIGGGLYFNFASLISDGMQTLSDFITDIVSFIGIKVSKKRPTKSHPFLLLLSIFIVVNGFISKWHIPSLLVLFILFVALILKIITLFFLYSVGKKINSQLLITSYQESKMDLYSSIGVIVATILLQFSDNIVIFRYVDIVVALVMGFVVFRTAFNILKDNSMNLIGKVEDNLELYKKIEEFLLDIKGVEKVKFYLIRYGKYYKIQLMVEMDANLTLRQVTRLEEKIKKELVSHRSFGVKYPTIYVTSNLDD